MKKIINYLAVLILTAAVLTVPVEVSAQKKKAVKQTSSRVNREAQKLRQSVNQKADASMGALGVLTKETQAALTIDEALKRLKDGNARFVADKLINQRKYRAQVPLVAKGQFPFAAILSCVDSRSSVEDLFDLNNGDAFNARIAGNIVNDDVVGSLEFATKVMNSKLIVVLGHTNCGAVKGACDDVKLGSLTGLLGKITPAVDVIGRDWKEGVKNSSNHDFVEAVGEENVELQMQLIKDKSPIIKELIEQGKVRIVGAVYELETGKVRFLN